jgi:uncharacterized membrane protein YeaQ/YmgE (transglycosylase-associated protein family)
MTPASIDVTSIVAYAVFGLVVGMVIHIIDPGRVRGGLSLSMFFGMFGAIAGGLLAPVITGNGISGFNFMNILIGTMAAAVLVLLQRLVMRNRDHIRTSIKQY